MDITKEDMYLVLNKMESKIEKDVYDDIKIFIDNSEWALAVEAICDVIFDDEIPIQRLLYNEIKSAAMNLNISTFHCQKIEQYIVHE